MPSIKSKQSNKPPIQAKQRPIQAKQSKLPPIQTKQSRLPPIQANAKKGFTNALKSMAKNTSLEEAKTGSSTSLPDPMKTNMEQMGGVDLSDVKVFPNSEKPVQLKAEAYAQGNEIHLSNGQHLGHEAWHVVQQKQGRVTPTIQANNGAQINADPALEKEADDMGAKVRQMKQVESNSKPSLAKVSEMQPLTQLKAANTSVVQCKGQKISGYDFDNGFYATNRDKLHEDLETLLSKYDTVLDDDYKTQLDLIRKMMNVADRELGEDMIVYGAMLQMLEEEQNIVQAQMDESQKPSVKNKETAHKDSIESANEKSSVMDEDFAKEVDKPSSPKLSATKSQSHDNDKQSNSKTAISAEAIIGNNNGNQVMEKAVHDNHLNIENESKASASGYKQAMINHRADRECLKKLIAEGIESDDRMFRNTCEWIKEEGVELFAITSTHDTDKRGGGQCAYFPDGYNGGNINGSETTYSENIDNNKNVGFTNFGTLAWALKNRMFVLNASRADKQKLIATLTHEVQHLADQHDSADDPQMKNLAELRIKGANTESLRINSEEERSKYQAALEKHSGFNSELGIELSDVLENYNFSPEDPIYQKALTANNGIDDLSLLEVWKNKENNLQIEKAKIDRQLKAQKALKCYKTEFRAYSYELYSPHTDVKNQVLSEYDDKIGESYEENELLYNSDSTFREAIEAYKNPDNEGFNKYNSIRVNSFFKALQQCNKGHNAHNEEFIALAGTIEDLKAEDIMYILTEGLALRNMVRARLGTYEAKLIFGALQRKAK